MISVRKQNTYLQFPITFLGLSSSQSAVNTLVCVYGLTILGFKYHSVGDTERELLLYHGSLKKSKNFPTFMLKFN